MQRPLYRFAQTIDDPDGIQSAPQVWYASPDDYRSQWEILESPPAPTHQSIVQTAVCQEAFRAMESRKDFHGLPSIPATRDVDQGTF